MNDQVRFRPFRNDALQQCRYDIVRVSDNIVEKSDRSMGYDILVAHSIS